MIYLLAEEITGFFSFLNTIIEILEKMDHVGLALYTFIEVLLIIPPIEVIYYPLIQIAVLNGNDAWYLYIVNVIFFNVIASMVGYYVGMKIGYPVLKFLSNEEILEKAKKLFDKWGVLAVAIGAFTPIPYTIVVFLAGISKMNFKKFVFAGFIGRAPRYILGGYLVAFVVDEISDPVINQYILILSLMGMLIFVFYYIFRALYKVYQKKQIS